MKHKVEHERTLSPIQITNTMVKYELWNDPIFHYFSRFSVRQLKEYASRKKKINHYAKQKLTRAILKVRGDDCE